MIRKKNGRSVGRNSHVIGPSTTQKVNVGGLRIEAMSGSGGDIRPTVRLINQYRRQIVGRWH